MYDNLYDALTRAYELGAPYNNASIRIILTTATHAMLRTNYGYYLPKYSDKNSQTTWLEITT
jgi:phage baseplate assembly protein W